MTQQSKYADQISSLSRQHVVESLVPCGHAKQEADALVTSITVQAKTFPSILAEFGENLDLLLIDAEGYDCKLLKTFPFNKYQPELIVCEHSHLRREERDEIPKFFTTRNYTHYFVSGDVGARRTWVIS